jgi:LuxR family transcriptional regulator, quorum-sensing system regulator CciR
MTQLADIQAFIDTSRQAESPDALHSLMQDITREMGFDHFAMAHHVDLKPFGTLAGQLLTNEFFAISNYPQAWMDQFVSDEIVSFDPVLLASQRTNVGFGWHQLGELIQVTQAHREVLERAKWLGVGDGFTVPANVPGEFSGSCNFAVSPLHEAPRSAYPMAQLVGSFAFQSARKLVVRMRASPGSDTVQLTDRQLECIVLVARGKTDWEISKILGISEETVKQHIADARQRYDVPKRVQVVLRALFDGLVPLSEMLV